MIRSILKDKELQYVTVGDINAMSSGEELDVLVASANQGDGYFLGYSGASATGYSLNTNICSQAGEYAYFMSKGVYGVNNENFKFHIYKSGSNTYLYQKDNSATLSALPTATVEKVVLRNTYNNVTRFLGVNGTSITSTTDEKEAKFNEMYHWELQRQGSGQFRLYNAKSNRYIRYANSTYSLNTSATTLYFAYTNNAFTIANSNSYWSTKYFMYMSSNTALARTSTTTATERLWTIIEPKFIFPTCSDDVVEEKTEMLTENTSNVLLRNTYSGTTRYLGMTTGNAITSTTSLDTALASDYYRWNFVKSGTTANRFYIQNAHSNGRRIRYSNNAFSISTTQTALYIAYTSGSGFRIMGSNGSNYMYMSGNTTLNRNQYTAQYWNLFIDKTSDFFNGWDNTKMATIETAIPSSNGGMLAGYKTGELLAIGEIAATTMVYLNHGESVSDLDYIKDKTSPDCAWILYDVNRTKSGGEGGDEPGPTPPTPTGPKLVGARYYSNTVVQLDFDISYPYGSGDKIDLTITIQDAGRCGMLLHYDDGSSITGNTIHWDSLTIVDESGQEVLSTSSIGWLTSSNEYTGRHLTNGGDILAAEREDFDTKETYAGAVGFTAGSGMSPAEKLTLTFKGLYIE